MIINVYKPKNWTSFDVVAKARGVLGVKKAGHSGTLDPLAEGVLILLTGDDTKRQSEFMEMEKEYIAKIAFGAESPTFDLEIVPIFTGNTDISALPKVLPHFIGDIEQIVPPYSAKKINGKEMYKLARKGIEILEQRKEVKIFACDVVNHETCEIMTSEGLQKLPCVTFKIRCSSGTFVRSLAYELGKKLGTGGVLAHLVRSAVGTYKAEDSVKIEDLLSVRSQ